MANYRLYIADMDMGFIAGVRRSVAACADIEVVGNSGDGRQAMKDILRLSPQVVLADIPLPRLDGIALLRETQRLRNPPSVIICTRFCSDATMQCASRYGATFFLCKPVEFQSLPALILECGRSACEAPAAEKSADVRREDNLRSRAAVVRALLKEIGMPARLDGSAYILEAALHCRGDDALFKNLSHGLYAELARRLDTTAPRIERSVRNAIAVAYERGSLSQRFPRKPTNKAFLEYIMRAVDAAERAQA